MRDLFDEIVCIVISDEILSEEQAEEWILFGSKKDAPLTEELKKEYSALAVAYQRWYEEQSEYNYKVVRHFLYHGALWRENALARQVERWLYKEIFE